VSESSSLHASYFQDMLIFNTSFHQRNQLAKTSKLLQQQRQQLKHYRDIYRLKQLDLEFKKAAQSNLNSPPPPANSVLSIRSDVRSDELVQSRARLEEAAALLHSLVRLPSPPHFLSLCLRFMYLRFMIFMSHARVHACTHVRILHIRILLLTSQQSLRL
jgi:hypothetical protein